MPEGFTSITQESTQQLYAMIDNHGMEDVIRELSQIAHEMFTVAYADSPKKARHFWRVRNGLRRVAELF